MSLEQHGSQVSLTLKGLTLQFFLSKIFNYLNTQNIGSEPETRQETQKNLHKATGAVGDKKHLLAMISQLGQHRAGLLSIADVLF